MELRWMVGSSRLINDWDDRWLPSPGQGRIVSPRVGSVVRVSNLILLDRMLWDEDLIDSVFQVDEARLFKSILLSSHPQKDCLVWGGEHSSVFTIRSGYRLLLPTPNIASMESKLFKQIWAINSPQKSVLLSGKFVSSICQLNQSYSINALHMIRAALDINLIWKMWVMFFVFVHLQMIFGWPWGLSPQYKGSKWASTNGYHGCLTCIMDQSK